MKKNFGIYLLLISILVLIIGSESVAQMGMRWKGSGGWGAGTGYGKMYNLNTVETINGEVIGLDQITPMKGMSHGIHISLRTGKETISVHLGPGWFIENQDIRIELEDKVEVKGSRVTFKDQPAIIAAEIKKGDDILKLRDDNGYPYWSGWRRQ